MSKKICSAFLAICIMISVFAVTSVSAASGKHGVKDWKAAANLVSSLGIMDTDASDEFDGQKVVTRGQFALYAAKFMNYPINPTMYGKKGSFDDVDISTEQGAAIQFLADTGAVSKDTREFNPKTEISYAQAVTILLNCLGYRQYAEAQGGYPNGYLSYASINDMDEGIKNLGESKITKADAVLLMYNSLFVYPMEYIGTSYNKANSTILEKNYSVHEISGIVTNYGITSLQGNDLREGSVAIDGTIYDCKTSQIRDYVGYHVRAYYEENREGTRTIIAFAESSNKNSTVTFDAEDVTDISNTSISYDTGRSKKTQKIARDASVIYNNRYYGGTDGLETLIDGIADGDITCISNDSSSTASVIVINSYKHLLLERVDKRGYKLYSKNGSATTKPETDKTYVPDVVTIDPSLVYLSVYAGDNEVGFNEIQPGDAIAMKQSADGKYVELKISRNVVTGTIEAISNETVEINSTEYDISPFIDKPYSPGISGTFAITTNGKILGLVEISESANSYAYVLDVYTGNSEQRAYVKIFNSLGNVVTAKCANNVQINGTKTKYQEVKNLVSKGELITCDFNSDDEIRRINRPYDASSNYISMDNNGNMNLYVNETDFVKDWNKSSVRHTDGIMGMTFITEDTTIFAMPRFDEQDESDYRILKGSDLENRTYSDVTAYDIDRQGRAGALVIVEDLADSVSMSSSLFFVSQISTAVDDDGEIRQITGFQNGEELTLNFDENTKSITYEDGWMNYSGNEDFDTGYENLNRGDAIQYVTGTDGRVAAYRLVYNNRKSAFDKNGNYIENNVANYFEDWSGTGAVTKLDFSDNLYIAYGDVQMSYLDYMVILGLPQKDRLNYASSLNSVSIMDYCRPINLLKNAYVYVYDMTGRTAKLTVGDMGDIQRGDVCFVRSKKMGELNEIMVYRK